MRAQIQSIHLSLSSRRKGERRIGLRDGQQVSRLVNPTRTQQQRHEVAVNMARPLKPESLGQQADRLVRIGLADRAPTVKSPGCVILGRVSVIGQSVVGDQIADDRFQQSGLLEIIEDRVA